MRLGIDWGGTKIEIIALSNEGEELFRQRVACDWPEVIGRVANELQRLAMR